MGVIGAPETGTGETTAGSGPYIAIAVGTRHVARPCEQYSRFGVDQAEDMTNRKR